ncbi:MAG TPA: 3'(2'),5'-bisphosphate nucleotidase CysQ, partial [Candidatus Binataceae bacterium]|nr:3'(2'),5'-bisphosphate nucleotidase CysQ [Candidatus Binataceae bacterium]
KSISDPTRRGRVIRSIKNTVSGELDLTREVEYARTAALAAGEILVRYYGTEYEIGSKGKNNPVTIADTEADSKIKEILTHHFPDYGWLSEETVDSEERLPKDRVWIVDPLDGTKEFIAKIPEFCVAIGLSDHGEPVVGVTYNPITEEMFWCARGMGCHLDNHRVSVTKTAELKSASVLASRSETTRGEWEVFKGVLVAVPTGSVAYKLAMVAGGKADATFTRKPKNEWDIASGAALIIEAGGTMTDIDGKPMRFNQKVTKCAGMIASNGILHDALMEVAPHQGEKAPAK